MYKILEAGSSVFDTLHCFWEGERNTRRIAAVLSLFFVLTLGIIELNRQGLLPGHLGTIVPTNHFYAVNLAFTLVLIVEVVSMVFILPKSFSRSVGKQLEILCLILLRSSFKELINLHSPMTMPEDMEPLLRILSDGLGALAVFLFLGLYVRMHRCKHERMPDGAALYTFVVTKKVLALALLGVFCAMGAHNVWAWAVGGTMVHFFEVFYTVLIFSDIFVVLIAQRYLPQFEAVFRNSGLALTTLFIRLALEAPPFWNSGLGVGAAGFAVLLTLVQRVYSPQSSGSCLD